MNLCQRGSRERTSLSKETYTVNNPQKIFPSCDVFKGVEHRVSIERKSPYKESYTVNSHRKSFDDVMGDVRACLRIQISR